MPKIATVTPTEFQGTDLEKDVIRAACTWFEEASSRMETNPESFSEAETELYQSVMELGAREGGF